MAKITMKIGLSDSDKTTMANQITAETLNKLIPAFSTSVAYTKGQYTMYSNALYRFTADKSAGEWDSTKVESATLNDLVDDVNEAVASVDDKANKDGYYAGMSVGYSDNLTPYSDESGNLQTIPFVMQGTGCGNGENIIDTGSFAQLKEKRGNSVVVNQLLPIKNTVSANGVTFTNNNDGSYTLNGTATADTYFYLNNIQNINGIKILYGFINFSTAIDGLRLLDANSGAGGTGTLNIVTWTYNNFVCDIRVINGTTLNNIKVIPIFINLTQWFGSNDRIPAHLLSHPEDFGRYYSGSLAYNAGTIVDSNGRYLKTIGRQQWNEEWEKGYWNVNTGQAVVNNNYMRCKNFIEVIPNTTYYLSNDATSVYDRQNEILYFDKNQNIISYDNVGGNATFTTPSNCSYIKFYMNLNYGNTYNNDITISLYYEDESGYNQYYPYEELENVDTGTEVLRSAGSVYDVKKPSGEITRNVSVLDLATVANYINYQSDIACWRLENQLANVPYGKYFGPYEYPNMLSVGRTITYYYDGQKNVDGKMSIDANGRLLFGTGSTTTKPTGIVVYELATPTTEQGTSFQENIKIDDFGSMKWDNENYNGVPQGNAIFYPVNYKGFLDSLNNYTDGDITNLVKQSELTIETTARTSQDTILQNAIGGTLRQLLATSKNIDFANTDVVDISTLNWAYNSNNSVFYVQGDTNIPSGMKALALLISTNYTCYNDKRFSNLANMELTSMPDGFFSQGVICILLKNTSYTDVTTFKNAMKGVLLAYEKASS